MRISDWSSDVCSSDLRSGAVRGRAAAHPRRSTGRTTAMAGTIDDLIASIEVELEAAQKRRAKRGKEVEQIGSASCRERVCQYVVIEVVDVALKKKLDGGITST